MTVSNSDGISFYIQQKNEMKSEKSTYGSVSQLNNLWLQVGRLRRAFKIFFCLNSWKDI